MLGLVVLLAIPVLALARVFGEKPQTARASTARFDVEVVYPARLRSRSAESLSVTVHNRSRASLPLVQLDFDETLLGALSDLQFTPTVTAPSHAAMAQLPPGGRRVLVGTVQGERYGKHRGLLKVRAAGEEVTIPIETMVFP